MPRSWVFIDVTGRPDVEAVLAAIPGVDRVFWTGEMATLVPRSPTWLSERELVEFLQNRYPDRADGDNAELIAAKMFSAFMSFNQKAPLFAPSSTEEMRETFRTERSRLGIPQDEPLISLRLMVDPSRNVVATGSVIALARDPVAMGCWAPGNYLLYAQLLKIWASCIVLEQTSGK